MVSGFTSAHDFNPVIGWELYQITLDKYHVMFFFNNGYNLLNVASAFSHNSSDQLVNYTYDIYKPTSEMNVTRLLREHVVNTRILTQDKLILDFSNGDELIIHDDPNLCSWWFIPLDNPGNPSHKHSWSKSDDEVY